MRLRPGPWLLRFALCAALVAAAACAAVDARGEPEGASPPITIVAVGDLMLGGTAGPELERYGYDYPFVHVGEHIRGADLAFANLEGPLTERGVAFSKQYVFRSPPARVAPALARAGFDVVALANNHSMDYGIEGLRDTMAALARADIRYAGAGENLAAARRPAVLEVEGVRVAVLAYSLTFPEEFWAAATRPGSAFGHERHVRADVAAAREHADVVLVSFHWGREGTTELRDYQRKLGRAAIDAGAAAVFGHHPHVLQGVERYRGGVILYSLGNFVFGSYSKVATRSVIARLHLRNGRVQRVALFPINVDNVELVFQPQPLDGLDADAVVQELQRLSWELGTPLLNRDGVAVLELAGAS